MDYTTTITYDYIIRPIISWIDKKFVSIKITPNQITIAGLTNLILSYYFYQKFFIYCYIIYLFCDFLDGIHARNTKQSSNFGEIIDHASDSFAMIHILNYFLLNILKENNIILMILTALIFMFEHYKASYTQQLRLIFNRNFGIDEFSILLILSIFCSTKMLLIIKMISYFMYVIIMLRNLYFFFNKSDFGSKQNYKMNPKSDLLYIIFACFIIIAYTLHINTFIIGIINVITYIIFAKEKIYEKSLY